jgi:cytochrome c55X
LSRRAWAAIAFTALAVNAGAQQDPASAPAAASAPTAQPTAEAGRRVYTSFCVRCHGINLVSTSSAFFDLRTFPPNDKERFLRSVTNGLRAMPAWGGMLKPEQMEAVWLYIGSVNGWPKPPS